MVTFKLYYCILYLPAGTNAYIKKQAKHKKRAISMEYSPEEAKVLDYFFTNLDKPVFFSRNFHPEVWALMQARYSRAKSGMRESFLSLLKEDGENYNTLSGVLAQNVEGMEIDNASKKAIDFTDDSPKLLKARLVLAKMDFVIELADTFSWFCAVMIKLEDIIKNQDLDNKTVDEYKLENVMRNQFHYTRKNVPITCYTCRETECKCKFI